MLGSRPFALSSVALLAFVVAMPRARADETTAQAAFRQADELAKQGKWNEACPLYDASYHADPQVGSLLHLADCHEHTGRTATAWAEFSDAIELAHRKQDAREAYARTRADALAPKLAKLHLAPPQPPPPGLVVLRDGVDITALVGTDLPIDPGEHELTATAPGYAEWRKKITIGVLPTTTKIDVPALEHSKQPDALPPNNELPKVHQGAVKITSQPDAHIALDTVEVGVGHYEGALRSGGHQLRVTAPGMHAYQSEIFVGDDETRTIDVPLERDEPIVVAGPIEPVETGPSYEVGLSITPGEKAYADRPAVIAYRLDVGLRRGHRVNFGLFVEFASIDTNNACGTALPGAKPSTPFDFGMRDKFTSCRAFTPGLQYIVHVLPKRRWDPWIGIAPGFRFGFVDYTPYSAAGQAGTPTSLFMPGIFIGARAGLDYHPTPSMPGWAVGLVIDAQFTVIAQEGTGNGGAGDQAQYVSYFGGLRSSLAF